MEVTRIVVTDTKLFNRTGDVGRWVEGINTSFTAHAINEAPSGADTGRVNKTGAYPVGSLKASIHGDVDRIGPRQLQSVVSVSVPYALYVLKGTHTIMGSAQSTRVPKGEPGAGQFRPLGPGEGGMFIPANPGWGGARFRQRVRGQRANNFLGRAFDATARRHSSLRGFTMIGRV